MSQWGLPNGYVLGEEGSGAFVAGLRYGEGTLYTKNAGDLRVYWQGPSVGFDFGWQRRGVLGRRGVANENVGRRDRRNEGLPACCVDG